MFYSVELVKIIFWSVKQPDGKHLINVLRVLVLNVYSNVHFPNWQFFMNMDHYEVTGPQAWVPEHA